MNYTRRLYSFIVRFSQKVETQQKWLSMSFGFFEICRFYVANSNQKVTLNWCPIFLVSARTESTDLKAVFCVLVPAARARTSAKEQRSLAAQWSGAWALQTDRVTDHIPHAASRRVACPERAPCVRLIHAAQAVLVAGKRDD